jgi:DNA integrity scanning protein DisA with diadenylate cyclase activity
VTDGCGDVDLQRALDAVWHVAQPCHRAVVEGVVTLALEVACEGHEGHALGVLFTIGRADEVLALSRALILDPLAGHVPSATHVADPRLRGTVKQLAQLDGAFVVAEDGVVVAACRYLDVPTHDVYLPLGLGSRHLAAAAISKALGVIAVTGSTTGLVRVFVAGHSVATMVPHR